MKYLMAAAAWLLATVAFGGESLTRSGFNIDFNLTAGTGSGVPASTFGGAAGQPGVWNSVGTGGVVTATAVPIVGVDGVSTATFNMLFTGSNLATIGTTNANTSGDHERLLDDILDLGGAGRTFTVVVSGLAPGVYEVYTYAGAPDNASYRTQVGLFGRPKSSVGGSFPVNGFTEGVTHARHRVAIGGIATAIQINVEVPTVAGVANSGSLAGLQIKPLNPSRLYVKPTGAGVYNDGLTWETALAFTSVASQIAGTTPSVTEVWASRSSQDNSGFPVRMRNGLSIYGGFTGTEVSLAARVVNATNPATLAPISGDPNFVGDDSLPHVVVASGTDATAVLDGFWISGGVADNAGDTAGGGLYASNGAPTVRNCRFTGNSATFGGGAVYAQNLASAPALTLTDCVITGNSGASGGGVNFRAETRAVLTRCAITGNQATAGSGGGVYCLGNITLSNCLIAENTASFSAGAAYCRGFSTGITDGLTMLNCTVARNATGGSIGGVWVDGPTYSVRNSVLWGNTSTGPASLRGRQFSTAVTVMDLMTDSTVEGWDGALAGPASLNNGADPRFVGAASGNYRLAALSPAIDTGWNGGLPGAAAATDLDGNARVYDDPGMNNAGFSGGTIDRGCFERQTPSAPCVGDIGRTGGLEGSDGLKNNNDLVVFINWFFAPDSRADVGRTGGVAGPDGGWDNNDFVVYIDMFFAACP
ncbi:MAG TPA: right-handed parallel beta-helix repeat-containing protein [Phycisphaerales bacterium]|nr:right-handed parallel beta-helix repeat-containing protein [Phycisphaerales bacterium]